MLIVSLSITNFHFIIQLLIFVVTLILHGKLGLPGDPSAKTLCSQFYA